MKRLIHLIYASTATSPVEARDLAGMLVHARAKNARLGVTGMLLFSDGCFFQVLEGDEDVVLPLFETISADPRHASIVTIIREPIAERSFSDWSMAFPRLDDDELHALPGLASDSGPRTVHDLDEGRAKKLVGAFVAGRWRQRLSPEEMTGSVGVG